MNRVFKTRWSVARQQYVVTDEEHASKGKASKTVFVNTIFRFFVKTGIV